MSSKHKTIRRMSKRRKLFYIFGLSIFVVQFAVYYVWANITSITLAFQKYELIDGNGVYLFSGFSNFIEIFKDFSAPENAYLIRAILRGILIYVLNSPVLFIAAFFSYYISRRMPGGRFFQIMLFAPGIVSGIIFISMYKYFVCDCIPAVWHLITNQTIPPLLDTGNTDVTFFVILLYSLLMSFGGGVLYITSAMAGISDSIIEATRLEGATPFKEFISIYFPLSWQTISISLIMSVSGFITADIGLFTFYGNAAPQDIYTLGYYMTLITVTSTPKTYPYIAALGILISCITIPITLLTRNLSEKLNKKWE